MVVQKIVQSACSTKKFINESPSHFQWISSTGFAIGDQQAGVPPGCWNHFDAIINCGSEAFDVDKEKYAYLFLDIPEGKKGQSRLLDCIPRALEFSESCIKQKKRVLVHCLHGIHFVSITDKHRKRYLGWNHVMYTALALWTQRTIWYSIQNRQGCSHGNTLVHPVFLPSSVSVSCDSQKSQYPLHVLKFHSIAIQYLHFVQYLNCDEPPCI